MEYCCGGREQRSWNDESTLHLLDRWNGAVACVVVTILIGCESAKEAPTNRMIHGARTVVSMVHTLLLGKDGSDHMVYGQDKRGRCRCLGCD